MKKIPHITLLFMGPFPVGNVSALRIMSYCKAMAEKGVSVEVVMIAPTAEAGMFAANKKEGMYEGVKYRYISRVTWPHAHTAKPTKLWYYLKGLVKTARYIRKNGTTCLMAYHNNLLFNFFFGVVTRTMKIPFIIDKTEYPHGYHQMSRWRKWIERRSFLSFDGFIVISHELEKFYGAIKDNVFLLPMTIDKDRFKHTVKKPVEGNGYIAVAFGTHNRDGVQDSVKAYAMYRELVAGTPLDLVLLGDLDGLADREKILKFIAENHLTDVVAIKGLVSIDDMPYWLKNAACLLTTPTHFESGGFPTKLGEYLLSGTPVVATRAGEIADYVTHGEDILLSQPGNLADIAHNLAYVHQHAEAAARMGEKGMALAKRIFNAETYVDELLLFVCKGRDMDNENPAKRW